MQWSWRQVKLFDLGKVFEQLGFVLAFFPELCSFSLLFKSLVNPT